MISQHGKTTRFIKLAIAASLLLSACSNKKETAATTTTPTTDYTSTYSDTSTIGVNYNSNLFDTTTTSDTPSATVSTNASTTYTPISTNQQNCLTNGYNWLNMASGSTPSWYGTGAGTLSSNCLSSDWSGALGQDSFYDMTLQSFTSMQQCSNYVMSKGPMLCTAGVDVAMAFQMSEMALVRCFRQILRAQMRAVRWNQDQTTSYNANDDILYQLLKQLASGK